MEGPVIAADQALGSTTVSILLDSTSNLASKTVAHTTTIPIHVPVFTSSSTDTLTASRNLPVTQAQLTFTRSMQEENIPCAPDAPVVFVEPTASMDVYITKDASSDATSIISTTITTTKQDSGANADSLCTAATTESETIPVDITGSNAGADVMTTVSEKSELSPSSLSSSLMTETAVLVETPRGLMLSVGDEVRAVAYSNLTDGAGTQGSHLLSIGNNCIPVALLSQCQQAALMEENGEEVVFEAGEEGVVEGDQVVTSQEGPIMCTTDLPLVTQQVLTVSTPKSDEPKKKNRGWPKGKRRKAVPEVHGPRAPMTGYVLFAINRRQQIKQSHPQLPFTEVTKILGQEWSCMPADKKQKYLDEAELDKQRYIEELKEFQKSDMYQTLLKKKRLKGNDTAEDAFDTSTDLEEDTDELHCRVCNLYFSSLHNKKEHMFGRQHLQAITDQLEKELKKQQKHQELAQQDGQLSASEELSPSPSGPLSELGESLESCKPSQPVDLNSFIVEFIQKNYERDQEIAALQRILRRDVQENWTICKQIQELKEYESKLRQDVKTLTVQTNTLSTQINTLKTVPALFGVIEF